MTIGHEAGILEKAIYWLGLAAIVLLGIAMAQPIWRGEEMVKELRSDCDKRGGVMIEHERLFGNFYTCASKLGFPIEEKASGE